ncbi:Domain of uncharacterised function (DUF2825) [Pseudomonas fluorescens]|uniref:Domain of uncharacterized function (DUF2825) n=1 Tax=Pseudomonas fluorescens TaxID=294 RepID=A0A3S4RMZ5_PSEFL|nr:Domain of uncharacterised function (DUF2825) [Pseudomonas fluorescens]
MWGTLVEPDPSPGQMRFIPTHVGNTVWLGFSAVIVTVHPHACGEHSSGAGRCCSAAGSSPRMWGTPVQRGQTPVAIRFIPTHVGNTRASALLTRLFAVHPHACGEHGLISQRSAQALGSSPRMWGTPGNQFGWGDSVRFIPTHVGNTPTAGSMARSRTVHPHACGEHGSLATCTWPRCGSSPRMWGTHGVASAQAVHVRFIPTHVGNT